MEPNVVSDNDLLASSKRHCQEIRTSTKDCAGFSDGNCWERADWNIVTRHDNIKWKRNNPSYTVTLTGQIQCHLKAVIGILLTSKDIKSSLSKSLLGSEGVFFAFFKTTVFSGWHTNIIAFCVSLFNVWETYHSDELNLTFSIYCCTIKTHYYLLGPTIPHFFRLKNCMWPLRKWEHHKIFLYI